MVFRRAIDSGGIFLVVSVPVSANLEFGPVVAIVLHSFLATHGAILGLRHDGKALKRAVHLRVNIATLEFPVLVRAVRDVHALLDTDIGPPMNANYSLGMPRHEARPEAREHKVDSDVLTLRCGGGSQVWSRGSIYVYFAPTHCSCFFSFHIL